jgi:hypothetical protein
MVAAGRQPRPVTQFVPYLALFHLECNGAGVKIVSVEWRGGVKNV